MNSVRLPAWFARASLVCLLSTTWLVNATFATPQHSATTQGKLPRLIATGQQSFEIPFTISPSQDSVVEVLLQVSSDRGKTWSEHSRRSLTSSAFPFSSNRDQELWFAIQTIDRNGKRQPVNQALKAELRIAVDTIKPEMEFAIRPDAAGRIVGTWLVKDKNIDPCSMEIQYRDSDNQGQWYKVAAQTCRTDVEDAFRDELAWWPKISGRSLTVRAKIQDLAGNSVVVERTIAMPMVAGQTPAVPRGNPLRNNRQLTARATSPSSPNGIPDANTNYLRSRIPVALSDQYGNQRSSNSPSSDSNPNHPSSRSESDRNRLRDQSNSGRNSVPAHLATTSPSGGLSTTQLPQPPNSRINRFASNAKGSAGNRVSPAPTTQWKSRMNNTLDSVVSKGSTEIGSMDSEVQQASKSTRVARQQPYYVETQASGTQQDLHRNSQSKTIAPTVSRSDPVTLDPMRPVSPSITGQSGIHNDGSSANAQWISSTTGINRQPPPTPSSVLATGPRMESLRRSAHPSNSLRFQLDYDIDSIGPEGVKAVELWLTRDGGNSWRRFTTDDDKRSPMNVEVEDQGIFGFRILVISNEGLRARQPRSGDPADMWVNVDTTMPSVQITAVPYGRGQDAGRLLVQWKAADANLRMRPVKLLYSTNPQGPWTTIEDGIRNEGQFAWKPVVNIPDQVYLKLEVRDLAGNIGFHQLDRPIDISGLIPRGHIRGIQPLREPQPRDAVDTST